MGLRSSGRFAALRAQVKLVLGWWGSGECGGGVGLVFRGLWRVVRMFGIYGQFLDAGLCDGMW